MQAEGIIVVGAGPGGAYTALSLAARGIPCTLIDRARFPRSKACGDILTSNVLRALHALDPAIVEDLLVQPWVQVLHASALVSHRGDRLVVPFHSPSNAALDLPSCLSARRADFDAFLLGYVRTQPLIRLQEGVHVREVSAEADGFTLDSADLEAPLRCRYLVLASGGNSRLVKGLLPAHRILSKHTAVGLRAYFENAESVGEEGLSEFFLFERRRMPGGLYITPFADGSMNVNLVLRYDVFCKAKTPLNAVMSEYLQSQPGLRARFAQAHMRGVPEGATLFFGTRRRPISAAGLLLVGDAAGLTDATNANGIGHAMISGGLAAATLAEAIAVGRGDAVFFKQYDGALSQRLKNALFPSKVMNLLFANPVSARLSAGILQSAFRRLNSKAVGELVYSPHTSRTLLDPRFYVRLFGKEKGI